MKKIVEIVVWWRPKQENVEKIFKPERWIMDVRYGDIYTPTQHNDYN